MAPTPMTDKVIVCVVLTGNPRGAVISRTAAAAGLGGETAYQFQLDNPHPDRPDDPPIADRRPNPIVIVQDPITQPGIPAVEI